MFRLINFIIIFLVIFGCSNAQEINEFDKSGYTKLMRVAESCDLAATRNLLRIGADPNLINSGGVSAMSLAVTFNHLDCLQELLLFGGDPNIFDKKRREALIFRTVSQSRFDMLKVLIEAGADVNSEDSSQQTPLMKAVILSQFDVAYYLLEMGANPRIPNIFGKTVESKLKNDDIPQNAEMYEWKMKVKRIIEQNG
ncbi:ankyrin repeat domain-containing protein [Paraglaciecola hydrolytica]|uniref:Uncharacterized protein n=1 Tax=Paraglaciecola hydrolytica TaxID=1799789 RepID=A0A135ZZT7_9ALTE|nr:ankyrin repeat domain-containing protein [Paraglaciecola hydrolytica]KXI28457.1 hypothetical protein AX660_15290 [Paraglaciecola hydrolytica]